MSRRTGSVLFGLVVAAAFAACGGTIDGSSASSAHDASSPDGSHAPDALASFDAAPEPEGTPVDAAPDQVLDAAAEADAGLPDCGPVAPGQMGAMSCGPNSAQLPLACLGTISCDAWCAAKNPSTRCATAERPGPYIAPVPAGMFVCYSCAA